MSYALFDDAGKFLAGRVMSEAESSMQIELDSGKRVKVKTTHVLLRFAQPAPAELLARARPIADEIDLDLAWEFAPEEEFGFADLARDYFSAQADAVHQAAALLRLFEAPHYFRRAGKGQFRKASAETVQAALAAMEKKRLLALQIEQWACVRFASSARPEPSTVVRSTILMPWLISRPKRDFGFISTVRSVRSACSLPRYDRCSAVSHAPIRSRSTCTSGGISLTRWRAFWCAMGRRIATPSRHKPVTSRWRIAAC